MADSSTPPGRRNSALRLLIQQRDKGNALLEKGVISEDESRAWKTTGLEAIRRAFGNDSPNYQDFDQVGMYAFAFGGSEQQYAQQRLKDAASRVAILDGLIELLEVELESPDSPSSELVSTSRFSNRIFIVHGHNEAVVQAVARFVEVLGFKPIILRDQPSGGRTIIEKFEDFADVGFAIVLLTGDDRGGQKSQLSDNFQLRPRQNVIFELGYFIGKLSRKRVCALCEPGIEILSDYSGVVWVEIDPRGAWKLELAKELKQAGFAVDMNKAL